MLLRSFSMKDADIRLVVGSDYHYDEYSAYPDMFGHIRDARREATLLAKKYKARLISNGDTTNPLHGLTKNSVIDNLYDDVSWSASELAEVGQEEDINEGNHGRGARGTQDHVEVVLGGIPGVNFMHEPGVKTLKGPGFNCYNFYIPYQDDKDDFVRIAKKFKKDAELLRGKGNICLLFTHQWFRGQILGQEEPAFDPSEESCWSLPSTLFDAFHANFNGHLHRHQVCEIAGTTSIVIGAPIQHNLGDEGQDRGVLLVAITKKGVAFRQHVFDQFPKFERVKVTQENLEEIRKKDWSKTYLKLVVDDTALAMNPKALEGFNANRMMPADWTLPPVAHDRLEGMTSDSPKSELLAATNKAMFPDLDEKEADRLLRLELQILEACKEKRKDAEAVLPEGKTGVIKFRSLHGENIGPFEKFDLPLDGVGVTVITAPNGSGKTSLVDSFNYTLFGIDAIDGEADSIVNDRVGKNCLGRVDFSFAGEKYAVTRPRKHKEHKELDFGSDTRPNLKGADPKGTEVRIKKTLGLTLDTFNQLVTIKSVLPFSSSTNTRRKELLEEVLEHEEWDAPTDEALRLINEEAKEESRLQTSINESAREMERLAEHLRTLRARKQDHASEKEETLSDLRAQRRQVEQRIEALQSKDTPDLDKLRARINTLKLRIKELRFDRGLIKIANTTRDLARSDLQKWTDKLEQAREKKREALGEREEYDDLDKLVGKPCPTCKHKVTREHAQSCQKEFQARLSKTLSACKADIVLAKKKVRAKSAALKQVNHEIAALERKWDEREEKERDLQEAQERLVRLTKAAQTTHGNKRALEVKLRTIKKSIAQEKNGENPYRKLVVEAKQSLAKVEARVAEIKAKQDKGSIRMSRLKMAKRAFSREGIRSLLLDQFVVLLTERSNHYLRDLSGGKMQVEFSTQREVNKGKKVVEEFSMRVLHLGYARGYKRCSSGERRRVDLSIMLALSDLLKSRRHRSYSLLWLDEVADPLDPEGCQSLANLLKKKAAESKMRILLVTFKTELASLFPHYIKVINEKGTARLDFSKAGIGKAD